MSYCQTWCLRVVGHAAIWSFSVVSMPSEVVAEFLTSCLTDREVQSIVNRLNNRPRNCVDVRKPNQITIEAKSDVALECTIHIFHRSTPWVLKVLILCARQ